MNEPIKIKLKQKYTLQKISGGGKSPAGTSLKKENIGLKARMANPKAIELYYIRCAFKDYWEQIPIVLIPKYKKIVEDTKKHGRCLDRV